MIFSIYKYLELLENGEDLLCPGDDLLHGLLADPADGARVHLLAQGSQVIQQLKQVVRIRTRSKHIRIEIKISMPIRIQLYISERSCIQALTNQDPPPTRVAGAAHF